MKKIVVVTAAYGRDKVRELGGQQALLPIIAGAGADGVEIRQELLSPEEMKALPSLASAIREQGLFAVYSIPQALFDEQGNLNAALPDFFAQAQQVGATSVKLSLGHYRPGCELSTLKALLNQQRVKLVVENDQTVDCGILSPLSAFFQAASEAHLPLSMTFDMANWHWVGQEPLAAALRLARYVSYVHVKAAARRQDKWHAIELAESDGSWRKLLNHLPNDVPRGIEFPLEGTDLLAITRDYVNLLRVE
ncbi:sugar phosphate isomerase/epimerase family protein [Edaphovirga cremea]|uniref:sugar phosphate isomerase/epimerase family protein n=1 Tax=Edaphovirga cremea TaxID=2267246 RepID=UPI000DEFEB01|nr:sugar phosphate isomerase/epimerase [Edaphovirga cremea]